MGIFSDYLFSILTVGIFSFICETVATGKKTSPALSKGLSLITSLCIFITVISPLFSGFGELDLSKFVGGKTIEIPAENYFLSLCEEEIEKILSEYLKGICTFSEIDVSLYKKQDAATEIKSISITISESAKGKEKELINAVKEAAGEETRVIINVKE